nr:P-loop NTPase fold protein [Bacillus wiedmannii]
MKQLKESQDSDLSGIKEELNNLLLEFNQKIFVFIDDIDRLTSEEIRKIFQLVKSVGDLPNINYILSFDREVVVQALNKSQENFGETYLEKIVQVPIDVPAPSESEIQKILFNELDKILVDLPKGVFNTEYWTEVYFKGIKHFIQSVRDVNRFCNAFRLNYALTREEVNPVDLIGITAIQMFLPNLYRSIYSNSKLFLTFHSDHTSYSIQKKEGLTKKYQQIIDITCTKYSFDIDEFIVILFPQMSYILKNISYTSGSLREWNSQKRICTNDHFPIYFKLGLAFEEVSKKEIEMMLDKLENLSDLETYIDMLIDQDKALRFLTRVEDYTGVLENTKTIILVKGLLEYRDKFPEVKGNSFDFSTNTRIERIIYQLYKSRSTQQERFELVTKMVQHSPVHMGLLSTFFLRVGREQGVYFKEKNNGFVTEDVSISQFKVLEKKMSNKIESWLYNPSFSKKEELPNVLFFWKQSGSEEKVTMFLKREMQEDRGLIRILQCFKTYSLTSSYDQSGVTKKYRINFKDLEMLFGQSIEAYLERITFIHQHLNEYPFGEEERSIINLAIQSMQSHNVESI